MELYRATNIPVFQNMMFDDKKSAMSCPMGDVVLVQDPLTGLVTNVAYDAELLNYDAKYQNEQACSAAFQRHLDEVTRIIDRSFSDKTLIEVGCGKGYFLEHLRGSGYEVTGVDPAYEGTKSYIVRDLFTKDVGLSAEGVILRHVLEHVPAPMSFLSDIACANGGRGYAYIEVPCFDWICSHRAWFDIFYEHVNYFRLSDFYRLFGTVVEAGHVFGGQYLFAVVDLATVQQPVRGEEETCFPEDFLSGIQNIIKSNIHRKRKAIWGGAAKGMMFALTLQRSGFEVDVVIDINPAKQGKYLAGTGLRVSSPEEGLKELEPGDEVFVMNSNYFDEILSMAGSQYSYVKVDEL